MGDIASRCPECSECRTRQVNGMTVPGTVLQQSRVFSNSGMSLKERRSGWCGDVG